MSVSSSRNLFVPPFSRPIVSLPNILKLPLGFSETAERLARIVMQRPSDRILVYGNQGITVKTTKKVTAQLLLDTVTGATAAYSLRKLRTAYAGYAVRVRRSSDNAEMDIGFSGNNFDEVTFLVFIGVGSGYVKIWYDQSGNAYDVSEATNSAQPQVVLNARNGKPALFFNGAQGLHHTSTPSLIQPNTLYIVGNITVAGTSVFIDGDASPNQENAILVFGGNYLTYGGAFLSDGAIDSDFKVLGGVINGASSAIRVNGSAASGNAGSDRMQGINIGIRNDGGIPLVGNIADAFVWNALLDGTQLGVVEVDCNAYYTLY